ncbi:unnamed protein product [Owenia fusiformis]|uniref:Uncharacterized protein n=1 Tax=Owenia fusiformis TaxID=6347 RepID=A0A8J1U2C2_OWEFU|nr:unnamed protein product [Owenia fusiformis]
MDEADEERQTLVTQWYKDLKTGTDFDGWGQPVEAIEGYQRLAKTLQQEHDCDDDLFSDEQKKILGKIAACLKLRSIVLQKPGQVEGISLEDLKRIEPRLKSILSAGSKEFPVDVTAAQVKTKQTTGQDELDDGATQDEDNEETAANNKARGTLLPIPDPVQGKTLCSIRIEKIGLKDATQYLDTFMSVSVKDLNCVNLTVSQDTPITTRKEDMYIHFGVDVHIQKPLEFLPQGYAIFFELKHYKPKKKMISTKCWAMLEKDEVKEGPAVIELYKKPTDFRRKNIHLLTVKPLYLHLKIVLN